MATHATVLLFFIVVSIYAREDGDIINSIVPGNSTTENLENHVEEHEKVDIKLFYECMCPFCRDFMLEEMRELIANLNEFSIIHTYPYGNAKTMIDNETIKFECQHGPQECYGNKLHACAIDTFPNETEAILYNACMMEYSQSDKGSDNDVADQCAQEINIDSERIKQCANSSRGDELLKYYGEESKKKKIRYVPYVLINDVVNDREHFIRDVCAALHNTPEHCKKYQNDDKIELH